MSSLYVGNPLISGMIRLPAPARGYRNPFDRSIKVNQLISGGTATRRALNAKQSFAYSWDWKNRTDSDLIMGFYTDAWGGGPYAVLDPAATNYLPLDSALMGSRRGVLTSWVATVGTVAFDAALIPFQEPGGVCKWTGAGTGSVFGEGQIVAGVVEALPGFSMPYASTEPYTMSVYARTTTGTASVTPKLSGRNAANTLHTDVGSTPVTLTTTTQRLVVSAAAGAFTGAQFVIPTFLCNTASAPVIQFSCPQLELASAVTPWVGGTGSPRCSVTDTVDSSVQIFTSRFVTLALREI